MFNLKSNNMKKQKTELDVAFLVGVNIDDINGFRYHINSEGVLKVSRNLSYSDPMGEDDELINNYITHINYGKGKIQKSTMFPLNNDFDPGLEFNFELGGAECIYISKLLYSQLKEKYLSYEREKNIDEVLNADSPFY